MRLADILRCIDIVDVKGNFEQNIEDVQYDSRQVKPGSMFVCVEGFKVNGHDFAKNAVEAGAKVVVAQKPLGLEEGVTQVIVANSRAALAQIGANFYGNPTSKFKLIGVTGTNGKTTTTYLIKSILEEASQKVGLIGTIANKIGQRSIPAERTTPESLDLQKLFKEMAVEGADSVVMEVSSHALDLSRVEGSQFDVGIFTNLTQDHLDYHETLENYLNAKIKLFKMAKKGVVNIDDESGQKVIEGAACEVVTFGIDKEAGLRAKDISINDEGIKFSLYIKEKQYKFTLAIPGKFSVYNALGAIGACLEIGVDPQTIVRGLGKIKGVPGRSEVVPTGRDFTVVIDYAHTPDGVENILNSVKQYAKGRIVTLFGCGGDRDKTKRPIMGEIAGRLSDFCIVTSDNPRTEEPGEIIKQVEEGVKRAHCQYITIENRRAAIEYALENAQKDDVIVLAGKGHETYQILKDKTIHFDENEIVREILGVE